MKITFTKISLGFITLCMFMAGENRAATITATVSGNWSSASTWSGGAAGSTISTDNIIIPAGITVTLDTDVEVTSILGSVNVSGSLNSTGNKTLILNSGGTLSGNGSMNLNYLEVGTFGGMSFTGALTVNRFVNSNLSFSLGAQTTLVDTMYLRAGSITLGTGSLLTLNTNSNIKVEDGSLAINGGVFAGANNYNVLYVGSSKTTGIELSGAGFNNFYVQLSGSNQNLTLGSNTTINGTLHHTMGTLRLNGRSLTIKGDYMSSNNSMISGSVASDLIIETNGATTSPLIFTSGARTLNKLELNLTNAVNTTLGSDLAINGSLVLNNGKLNVANSSTLTINSGAEIEVDKGSIIIASGSGFDGTAQYNVSYVGASKTSSVELTGSGLYNVMLDMDNATDSVKLNSNTTIDGTLMLDKGSLNLNGKRLELTGDISTTNNGWFQANQNSELFVNTTTGLSDTLWFSSNMNSLNNFSINTGNGSNVMLGSDLNVENLLLVDGGVTIYNNNLTINATGAITGYDSDNYIMVNGTGSLMMNVNSSSPFVTFPVGTTTSYAPAYIQRNSGSAAMVGVSTHNGVWMMGTSGTNNALTESVVNRSWDISSVNTASTNLNVKLEWTTSMEVNGFDRNSAYIKQHNGTAWDALAPTTSTLTGTGTYQMVRNNVNSFGTFAVVDDESAVSVKELNTTGFSVYPNPAYNKLTLLLNVQDAYTVEVFDAIGNKAITQQINNGTTADIDLSSLNAGVYFVKIANGKNQSVKRIVKQ